MVPGRASPWSTVTVEIAAAIRLRKEIGGEWMYVLSGVLSIALGVALMAWPGAGALAVVLWIGGYAIAAGAPLIAPGMKLRRWSRPGESAPPGRDAAASAGR